MAFLDSDIKEYILLHRKLYLQISQKIPKNGFFRIQLISNDFFIYIDSFFEDGAPSSQFAMNTPLFTIPPGTLIILSSIQILQFSEIKQPSSFWNIEECLK